MNNPKGIADAQFQRAYAVYYSGNGDSALVMYHNLLGDYRSLGDSGGVAGCYNKSGFIYREQGDPARALENYHQALKSNLNEANKTEAGNSYLNIGLIHHDQEEYKDALKFELMGLAMYEQAQDKNRTANALLRIGNVYLDTKQDSSALVYYQKSFAISQEIGSNRLIAICLNNMAMIYTNWGEPKRALGLYKQALVMREKIGDKNGKALVLNNIGDLYTILGQPDSGIYYANLGLNLAKDIGYKDMEMTSYLSLALTYKSMGNFEKSYEYYIKYHTVYVAINNEKSTTEINRLNTSLEAERKQKQIELLFKEGELREAAYQQERTKGWFLALGLIAVVAAAVLLWINSRKTRRTNILLESQKSEIAEKKKIVDEQHRDIVDSINYALRIQHAVLPSRDEMKTLFPESFLIYKPRDIVSGDFWWMAEKAGVKVIVVADCTGHGVPGAFMSLIGTSLLNEIVNEKSITDPGLALNMLSEKVVKSLHQNEERATAHDGMDVALAVIDENADLLMFAGANNSLYYTNIAGELHELKGDRQPIGFYGTKHRPFNVQTMPLKDVTNIWMFTDGYVDQFCGNQGTQFGKKYKYSRLKTTLTSIQSLNSTQQKEFLMKTFEEWKGSMFQVDDVLMIGIKYY